MSKRRHQHRRGGRVTPRKDELEFPPAREGTYELHGPVPTDADHALLAEIIDSGWQRYWPLSMLILLTYGNWDRRSQPSYYMQFVCAPHFVPGDDGSDPDLDRPWADLEDEESVTARKPSLHRFATAAGLPDPVTCADLVSLGAHYGLFTYGDAGHFVTMRPVPKVRFSGVLNDEEVWQELNVEVYRYNEPAMNAIVNHMVDQHLDTWKATLTDMALQLDTGMEEIRKALIVLAQDDDFTVTPDWRSLPDTASNDIVTVTVNWEVFDRERVHLAGTPEGWVIPKHMFGLQGPRKVMAGALSSLTVFSVKVWRGMGGGGDDTLIFRMPIGIDLFGLQDWMSSGGVTVLWPGHSIAMSPDEAQKMNDALDADPDIDDLHRAVADYTEQLDRHYRAQHPDFTVYRRPALEHEACRPDGTACVEAADFEVELTQVTPVAFDKVIHKRGGPP